MKSLLTFLVSFVLLSPNCLSKVWQVPGQCPTIQEALDICLVGDTILVSAGTYDESLIWPNTEGICLISELGADSTIIRPSDDRVISITTGIDSTTIIKGFTIRDGWSIPGAGIYILDSSPLITNNIITENNGGYGKGGGILCEGNSSPQIIENTITYNHCSEKCGSGIGGGIYCDDLSAPIIRGNIISNNSSGAIVCDNSSPVIIDNIIVKNWGPRGGMGGLGGAGGINCSNSSLLIIGNDFIGNIGGNGGAINCGESSVTIINNTINADTAGIGAGIYLHNSTGLIAGNNITNNVAEFGGGIYCEDSSPIISENTIDNNTSEVGGGGGIRCINSSPTIEDNSISWNTAGWAGGIACYSNSSPIILNNDIVGNTATNEGGGIHCWANSSPKIDFCVVANNTGDGITCDSISNPIISWNDIANNSGYGIRNLDSSIIIIAENNWWGHLSGPSGVGSGLGNSVSDWVDFEPWLLNPLTEVEEQQLSSIPNHIELMQNYPNPFNPNTKIKYSIPQQFNVVIKVFDILGNEIETLVNEVKPVGTHEITWYAENLPSGIYFYQLQTPNFTQTKKMVLMK